MKTEFSPRLVLLLVILAAPTTATAQSHPYTGMVTFGDSYSDGGNMNALLSSITEKTAQHLTGWDPNYYYNYRFSNGPVWTDYLYTSLGLGAVGTMGANDGVSNTNGTNFAWAESRSGTGTAMGYFPNLQTQIGYYSAQLGTNAALTDPGTTLFTIWSGANDVFDYVERGGSVTPTDAANNISLAITTLYGQGGRYFLVPNLFPVGLNPGYIDDPVKGPLATSFVDIYNQQLELELAALSASLVGISIIKVDVHGLFLEVMEDPDAYGFSNVTGTSYNRYGELPYEPRDPPFGELTPNSEAYFFWDEKHFTSATNGLIAEAAYRATMHAVAPAPAVPEPAVTALFVGGSMLAFVLVRRRRKKFS